MNQENEEELTQSVVEAWLDFVSGPFHYTTACDSQFPKEQWGHLRIILHRLAKNGLVERVYGKDGWWQVVENGAAPLDWQNYEQRADSGLILPFDLRKYVFIYPDSTIVVAGSKSSGKTGFLYRTIVLNMHKKRTILLTNLEGGIGMLKARFDAMDVDIPKPSPFKVIPVYENFHHYIKESNTLYIIDYIDAPEGSDFYMIGSYIKNIDRKLQGLNSIAVIGLQKPSMRDTAFGGEQTLKTASLYIAMDSHKLKIVDAKVSVDKKTHPKNMAWNFEYEEEGTNFVDITPAWEN